MKLIILALGLLTVTPFIDSCAGYKHKSENEIVLMSPAQRVDEWVAEQVQHRFDLSDHHGELVKKYILRDGLNALPRMIEIMNGYDPTRFSKGMEKRGERFDAVSLMLDYIDRQSIRLRGSDAGREALNALEQAIQRMRAAGYGQKNQHESEKQGRFELSATYLKDAEGINLTDRAIRDTFRLKYRIVLPEEELVAFSNFLVTHHPEYPSWSETDYFRDSTQINEAGFPRWVYTFKDPERFYEAYLEFKKERSKNAPAGATEPRSNEN